MSKVYLAIAILILAVVFYLSQLKLDSAVVIDPLKEASEQKRSQSQYSDLDQGEKDKLKSMSEEQRAEYLSLNTDKKNIQSVNQSILDDQERLEQIEAQLRKRDEKAEEILQRSNSGSSLKGEAQ